jgi:hypothetical protein
MFNINILTLHPRSDFENDIERKSQVDGQLTCIAFCAIKTHAIFVIGLHFCRETRKSFL